MYEDEEAKKSITATVLPRQITAAERKRGGTSCLTVNEGYDVAKDPRLMVNESVVGEGLVKTEVKDGASNVAIFDDDKPTGPREMPKESCIPGPIITMGKSGKSSKVAALEDDASDRGGVEREIPKGPGEIIKGSLGPKRSKDVEK